MAVYKYIFVCLTLSCFCCVLCELNLNEDEPCITEGLNGTCVGIFRCTSASLTYLYTNAGFDLKRYNLPALPDICSYKNNEPVVCCTDCNITQGEALGSSLKTTDFTGEFLRDGSGCAGCFITVEELISATWERNGKREVAFIKNSYSVQNVIPVAAWKPTLYLSSFFAEFREYAIGPLGVITKNDGPVASSKCLEYFGRLPYPCRGSGNIQIKKIWKEDLKCHQYNLGIALAVGGRDAQRWEFPHVALIGYGDSVESAQWLCGGSVISERFILTAGHCTSTRALGNISFAALGLLKRTDPKEYWKIHNIKRIIIHPEYKPPSKYHDIALLETETEINFGRDLLPACLAIDTTNTDSTAEASGWGRLGHKQTLADTLQVVYLNKYSDTECSTIYQPHRLLKNGYDNETQMCYGSHDEIIDTCEGDSGGPLQTNDFKCLYTIAGVTSYGKDCGILGSAGMYTRVAHYVPWIESVVWPEETEAKRKKDNLWLDKWLS